MCFFFFLNRGNTEGTTSSKILCLTFVYVLLYVNLCQDWFCGFQGICGLMTCVNRRQIEICFSPDVILCGCLGSKCQLTNVPCGLADGRVSHLRHFLCLFWSFFLAGGKARVIPAVPWISKITKDETEQLTAQVRENVAFYDQNSDDYSTFSSLKQTSNNGFD